MRKLLLLFLLFSTMIISAQDDDLPIITIDNADNPSDGYIYMATLRRNLADPNPTQRHLLVLDNEGNFVYQEPIGRVFNFGRASNGLRYYFAFTANGAGRGASNDGIYLMTDDEGNIVREYTIQGDYPTQSHEFIYMDNGHVMLLSQPLRTVDLSEFGGDEEALVAEALIQELDEDNNIVWEWRSWEHFDYADTVDYEELTRTPPDAVSYSHVNAFAIDVDGNIILSARRFDELIKIDYETGDIIWRMGGTNSRNNQFNFIDDPLAGFTGQHHIQVLENGNYLLFDNGNNAQNRPARAVEYAVDEDNLSATLVWSFTDIDGRPSGSMGSVQRLDNGNTLIGWGSASPNGSNVTEVNAEGEIVFALSLPPELIVYRVYRYDE
ncbi:MAG: hypothetical protein Crog4KO_35130 [Crocinitomicaceae bacterium]